MKRLVVIPVALALIVGAMVWRSPGSSSAATINGQQITTKQINNELAVIEANPSFACYLNGLEAIRTNGANGLPALNGAASSQSYSTAYAAQWLSQQIDAASVSQWNQSHHVVITNDDLTAARNALNLSIATVYSSVQGNSQYSCGTQSSTVLSSLPTWFQNDLIEAQANSTAMIHAIAGDKVTPSGLESYFATHKANFEGLCLSVIIAPDELTARSFVDEIKAGASFEQIAKDHSLDSSSSNGGAYGCVSPSNSNYSQFLSLVGTTQAGQIAPLVALQGGRYAILRVDSRGNPTFDEVKGQVAAAVLNEAAIKTQAVNQQHLRSSSVTVNPVYGTWRTSGIVAVVPPASPPKSSLIRPTL